MRRWLLMSALPVLVAGCSCHRDPEAAAETPPAIPAAARDADTPATPADAPSSLGQDTASRQRFSRAATEASSTLRAYLTVLLNSKPDADAFWSGGKPAPRPDDAVLRTLQGLQSLRMETGAAQPLDREDPPRALEVPIRITAATAEGRRRFGGWYRMRMRVDGQGWEITSASIQPVLD